MIVFTIYEKWLTDAEKNSFCKVKVPHGFPSSKIVFRFLVIQTLSLEHGEANIDEIKAKI